MSDLAIIGSGPAGLTAALYAARANLEVTIYERGAIGGALTEIAHISNFPSFDGAGLDLAKSLKDQVKALGVRFEYDEVTDLAALDARTILLATGSEPRKLNFTPTAPVSYCALCDAPLYQGKNILVIGGGNSAVGESLMLADIAAHLTLMTHSQLKAEPTRIDQLRSIPNVTIIENEEPSEENTKGYDGIFVYIGKRPATDLIDEKHRDDLGFVTTEPGSHHVVDNIFVAGDVRSGSIKQAITASADGASAAIEIINFLKEQNAS